MTNKDLFKEAIADAKQVREAALANAKVALEEALTPRLQSMLSTKLQEMDDEGEIESDIASAMEEENVGGYTDEEEMEEGFKTAQGQWNAEDDSDTLEEDSLEEDFDLSEILAELEAEDKEEMKEAKEDEGGEEKTDEEEEEGEEEEAGEEAEEEVEVKDLTVDELKDIIKDIVNQELESEEYEAEEEEAGEEEMIDLGGEEEMMEEINLEELLAELDALEETEQVEEAKNAKEDDELKEAIDTINTLRVELQEVNLLNAKLLYVNKIFKAKNLTESQKVKVIASFDKATTAKEAKIIFESLESTLTATTGNKTQIKESLGFASKAAGVAPKKQIVEVNDNISRMQMLAGIK
jgi:hypothetical protein